MKDSKIQWCDDTVNPVMGCEGCELWPNVAEILGALVNLACRFTTSDRRDVREHLAPLINRYEFATELWHKRQSLVTELHGKFPDVPVDEWWETIESRFECYAGNSHLGRGGRPGDYHHPLSRGYAAMFERPEAFSGRMLKTARRRDLRGTDRPYKPWLNGLPRLIFVSDMGDALSTAIEFDYLKTEIVDTVTSPEGLRHIWLWLTKRPERMTEFAKWLLTNYRLSWPPNLVAMTSVTNRATRSRIDQLRKVPAAIRGLSVEPLVESAELNLDGIDWVIIGGESGKHSREFDLDWVRSIHSQCEEGGVAFFVKQLGANPVEEGFPIELGDSHGGEWDEWPEDLRVRELPAAFRSVTLKAATLRS